MESLAGSTNLSKKDSMKAEITPQSGFVVFFLFVVLKKGLVKGILKNEGIGFI